MKTAQNITSDIPSILRLEQFYGFRNTPEVLRFLDKNRDLMDVLLDASRYVERYLGPYPRVELELIRDPEIEGTEKLFAYIRTALPVAQALDQLDKLDEDWFLMQLERVGGRFNFNLQFV